MNTIREILKICDKRLETKGITRAELLRRIGQSSTLFNMAEKRNSYFNIETFAGISKELNITIDELLGLEKMKVPEDIKAIEEMLVKISDRDRKIIGLIVKAYYDESVTKKN